MIMRIPARGPRLTARQPHELDGGDTIAMWRSEPAPTQTTGLESKRALDEDRQRRPEAGTAPRRPARSPSQRRPRADAPRALRRARGVGDLRRVGPPVAGHEREHRPVVAHEDERLHDLVESRSRSPRQRPAPSAAARTPPGAPPRPRRGGRRRARRSGQDIDLAAGRRGAARAVRRGHPDGAGGRRSGRLRAGPDRQVARPDLRRRAVVALIPGDRRGDPAKVAKIVGAEQARIAHRDEVVVATGFDPGAVAPFAASHDDPVLVERTILSSPIVWVGAGSDRHMAALARSSWCASRAVRPWTSCRNPHNQRDHETTEGAPDAGDRQDLDERRARRLGRREGARRRARAPLRLGRVRGDPVLRHPEGACGLPAGRSYAAPARLRPPPLHGASRTRSRSFARRRTTSCAPTGFRRATSGRSRSTATASSASQHRATRSRR